MTVGYGDIVPANEIERIFAIFLMVLGVVSFSFLAGTVSNIIASYDSGDSFD